MPEPLRILSWDVGASNLAYCILEGEDLDPVERIDLIDWDIINLINDDRITIKCCGNTKKGICSNKSVYYQQTIDDKMYGWCRTHLAQHSTVWSNEKTLELFERSRESTCDYKKKDSSTCDKNCTYKYKPENLYFCTAHYKSALNAKQKHLSPQLIKNITVKKYPVEKLVFTLINKLDELAPHFAASKIDEVIIENQPSLKNPKMKTIACALFNYFLIRGVIDKHHGMDIKNIKFICPNNKLKINEDNTISVLKGTKDGTKYKLTKALSVKYTKQRLTPEQLEYLELFKKTDDLCDSYLQGCYYISQVKFNKGKKVSTNESSSKKKIVKKERKVPKKSAGSKTSRKVVKL